ncbi:hypothetical protein TRFO_08996 [Tritrichomonas foetus]|uniref:Uncharacterized protein n=1 Tax=Tritrichomonas foetus TaxID=1144522 RepID=A0A1J4JG79_9EUKA|nr:hypothetical protein TRFO_08996 [Tritrichomonas foetus]|eukprot:OHS98152.1 hypothetical protein TRFO_08996 [Tritrichomonas foetus]
MKRRFEPVQSQVLDKFEKNKHYQWHMIRVHNSKSLIDNSQPELSPRHQLIAFKASQRQKAHMNQNNPQFKSQSKQKMIVNKAKEIREKEILRTIQQSQPHYFINNINPRIFMNDSILKGTRNQNDFDEISQMKSYVPFYPTQARKEKVLKGIHKKPTGNQIPKYIIEDDSEELNELTEDSDEEDF